jgi:hypothetical protein
MWMMAILSAVPTSLAGHKFYVSTTTLQISRSGDLVECTVKMFKDDLQLALKLFGGTDFELEGNLADTAEVQTLRAYLHGHVGLWFQGAYLDMTYLGYEVAQDMVWVYLECQARGPGEYVVKNDCLMEVFGSQTNLVHLSGYGQIASALLTSSAPRATLTL